MGILFGLWHVICSYLVGTPEIGHTMSVDVIRVDVVATRLADEFYDFFSGLARHGLPQTSRQSADDGRRERGSHIVDNGAATIYQSCRRSYGD